MSIDYSIVTELPYSSATLEQRGRLYQRYHLARRYTCGKAILEVGCEAGIGLGYLAGSASYTVGGDYTESLLRIAHSYYRGSVPLVCLDAQNLPFCDGSFDIVVLFEAIYYLSRPTEFFAECRRVLAGRGVVVLCTVNKEWSDFNPSPFSTRYFSTQELGQLLKEHGFGVELYGAFPVATGTAKDRIVSLIKRVAINLHLVPKTMKGKEVLKRLFFGKLVPIPPEITEGMAELCPLVALNGESNSSNYKVLYAVGRSG